MITASPTFKSVCRGTPRAQPKYVTVKPVRDLKRVWHASQIKLFWSEPISVWMVWYPCERRK